MAFNRFTKNVLNVSALPDRVQNQASTLKATFDQAGVDIKEALNSLITELEASTSASNIGANIGSVTTKTVQAILTNFEAAIANRYTKLEADTLLSEGTNELVSNFDIDLNTGIITITRKDGTVETFDTALEKVPAKFELVEENGKYALKITNVDGTTTQTDVTELIDVYTFNNSDYITFDVTGEGKEKTVTARIKANSIGLSELELNVVSTLEGYMASARDSASAAKTSETNARASELNALEAKASATNSASSATTSAQTATNASKTAQEMAQTVTTTSQQAVQTITSVANNAKTEVTTTATQAKAETNSNAILAKSYAVGGTGSRAGEDVDNAKYYSEQAKATVSGDYVTRPEFNEGIKDFATKNYVDTAIANIDVSDLDLTGFATETFVNNAVSPKADKTYVDNQLALKADKTYVDNQVATKVDSTFVNNAISSKADTTYVNTQIASVNTTLTNKADTTYVNNQVSTLNTAIAGKANSTHTHNISDVTNLQTTLDGKAPTSHNQAASTITAGTFAGQVNANASAVSSLGTSQVRNIQVSTTDLTAGTSALTTGEIYFVYE